MSFTFFFGPDSPFSNWFLCNFIVDSITFTSSEQYFMYQKAIKFNDTEMAAKILKTQSCKSQKMYGRKVQNFDPEEWDRCKFTLMKNAVWAKFSQNENLKKLLLDTAGTSMVEASPYDKIWGIGLAETDPRAMVPAKWKGQNLLGQVLDGVRDELSAT